MLGDVILWIKHTWKVQTCIHNYEYVYRKDTGGGFDKCTKCDKIR